MLELNKKPNWWSRCKAWVIYVLLVSFFAGLPLAQMGNSTCAALKKNSGFLNLIPEFTKSIKSEIDPCVNFYQFACGNFIDQTPIPVTKKYVDTFTMIRDKYDKQLREIVTEEMPETDEKYFRLPNNLFKGCMNTALIESLGAKPIQEISESLGGWPVVVGDSWDKNNTWTWQGLTKKLRHVGSTAPFLLSISVAGYNNGHFIEVRPPHLDLSVSYLNTNGKSYHNYMIDIAKLFGVKETTARIELSKSLEFEMKLARISEAPKNLTALNIQKLQDSYPFVEWLDLINAMLPKHLKVTESEIITLPSPRFLYELARLLERSDKRVIANYMMWKFHHSMLYVLSKEFAHRRLLFESVTDKALIVNREEECVKFVLQNLQIAVASMYIHKHIKYDTKRNVMEMFENIRNAFGQTLNKTEWLDDGAKEEAMKKLYSIKPIIGFPDELWDIRTLDKYYSDLEIDPNKFLQSYLNIELAVLDYTYGALRWRLDDMRWLFDFVLTDINVLFSQSENILRIPAAVLQDNIFGSHRPKAMNYGSVGFSIAHEIIHGFCGIGRLYNAHCEQIYWWKPSTEKLYQEKVDCFIEQYGNYTDEQTGLKVNGFHTLDENIADNGGMKQSYMAFNQLMAGKVEKEEKFPGLKYTPRQIFWISYAQTWCGKFTKEEVEYRMRHEEHSPHEFRVLGVLQNMKDFARDFRCSKNSPMNPERKCEIY